MKPLSKEEKSQVAKYRALRNRIHEGPLYTVLGENVRVKKQTGYGTSSRMVTDPFEGVETWSQRYTRRKRRLPQLNDMQFGNRPCNLSVHVLIQSSPFSLSGGAVEHLGSDIDRSWQRSKD